MTQKSKFGLNTIGAIGKLLSFAILSGSLLCACQRHEDEVKNVYLMNIDIAGLKPKIDEHVSYKGWAESLGDALKHHAYFYCVLPGKMVVAADKEASSHLILSAFEGRPIVSGIQSEISSSDASCQRDVSQHLDIREIDFHKPLNKFDKIFIAKSMPYFHPEAMTDFIAGSGEQVTGVKFGYPVGTPYIDQDLAFKMEVIRATFGIDCCYISGS